MAQNFAAFARGEPIDVVHLATLNDYIINVNRKLAQATMAKSSIMVSEAGARKTFYTEDVAIWTGKVRVTPFNDVPNPNDPTRPWSVSFGGTFRSPPVVTATPFCHTTGGGTIAPSAIWISNITLTGCNGNFKWLGKTTRKETVYGLIIAIGEGKPV